MSEVEKQVVAGVRYSVVDYGQFTDIDFQPPATFFSRSAMGDYYFWHTRERQKAQAACDELFGIGRYTVHTSKMQKGRGELTCRGTQTRRGQRK